MDPEDEGRLPRGSVRLVDPGMRRGWGRPVPQPFLSDRSALVIERVGVFVDEVEEEEEESPEVARPGHRGWSTESARTPSCCWAHRSSVDAAAGEAAAAVAATAAAADSSCCGFDATLARVDEF